jgi:tetratricopeptide (TPR) repeat protein
MTEAEASAPRGTAPQPQIWEGVPLRNRNFTGREGTFSLLRQGASSKITAVLPEDPLPQALQGLGGVGKTAVAIEYAYRYRSEYDVVWWISAEQLPLVRSSLAALAGRLGLESAMATGIDGAVAAALDALRLGHPYSRWLLIFDNADQPEEFRDYIPRGPGDVLITSRNNQWQNTFDTVQVDVFTREESKEFLAKRASIAAADPETNLLADKLGDLPLALNQAGAMLAETGMAVEEYIRLFDERVTQIMSEGKPPDYPASVTAAWELSVSKVRDQLPQALQLLRCCAFFGPEPIPRDVFRRGTQATGTQVSDLMADPILLAQAIGQLGRFALVTIDGRAITVHRLVQALLRDGLSPEEQARYREDAHTILASAAPENPADDSQWWRYRELLPHVTSETTGIAHSRDPKVRAFVLDMVRYLYSFGDIASCEALTRRFIDQWTADSGPDDRWVLGAQRQYGDVLRQLGRYQESYALDERILARSRAVLGQQDPITLGAQTAFAADQRARGDFAAARTLDEEALKLQETAFGATAPQTLRTINSLALDNGFNSDYRSARELSTRAYLLMSEATTGVSPTEVLTAWYNLAWAVRLQGKYFEARDVGQEAWAYGQERLGPDHFATLRAANGLSIALRRIAPAREQALQIAREVYDLFQRRYGDVHPDTMAAAINLTNAQRTIGLLDDALTLAESTGDQYPKVYGPAHPFNYGCIGNLALLHRVTGDPDKARSLNESALAGLDARLSRDHDYTLVVALNLASDLALAGDIHGARQLDEDSLERLIKLLGKDHPLTLGCAANLIADLRADGATAEAEALYADTMERYKKTLSLSHPDAMVAAEGRRLDFDFDPPPI